jgi:DNA transposition AAA+ family ATPase
MTEQQKIAICEDLERLIASTGGMSATRVAVKLGISPATISHMRSRDWALISDEMWRKASANIKSITNKTNLKTWQIVETTNYKILTDIFADAQENAMVMAVCGEAGSGKSVAARSYSDENGNVYLISCNEFWNRKIFLQELLREMGRNPGGDTVGEMMSSVVSVLKKAENPLLIIDEADKLSDQVLYFFITLYNQLEDHCGIVLMATDYMEKKIKRGLRLNKKGYKELYSRIGRKFITLPGVSVADITDVCVANGLEDKGEIKDVVSDSENDLRRVRRKVFVVKKKNRRK